MSLSKKQPKKKLRTPVDKQSTYNRIDNLKGKGFKPGKSGNLKGRPKKKKCIPDILNRIGDIIVEVEGVKITQRDFILQGVYAKAMKGDQWSIQFIADRTEGKPFITSNITLTDLDSPLAQYRDLYNKNLKKNLKAEKSD